MDRACLPGGDDSVPRKCSRSSSCRNRGTTVVGRCTQLRIRSSGLDLPCFTPNRGHMPLASRRLFLRGWTRRHAAIPAVVADSGYGVVNDRGVVDITDDIDVHVVHAAVVVEATVVPAATFIPVAEVAVAVVDPTIKADDRPPVAWS